MGAGGISPLVPVSLRYNTMEEKHECFICLKDATKKDRFVGTYHLCADPQCETDLDNYLQDQKEGTLVIGTMTPKSKVCHVVIRDTGKLCARIKPCRYHNKGGSERSYMESRINK